MESYSTLNTLTFFMAKKTFLGAVNAEFLSFSQMHLGMSFRDRPEICAINRMVSSAAP